MNFFIRLQNAASDQVLLCLIKKIYIKKFNKIVNYYTNALKFKTDSPDW